LNDVASYCGLKAIQYVERLPVLKGKIWPKAKKRGRK
jgi:hypothetical protein